MTIIINGAPKSATLFVSELFRYNLKRSAQRVATRGALKSIIMPEEYHQLISNERVLAKQHISPIAYNFSLLRQFPPKLFIQLVRDPKDVIISWKYHITRNNIDLWEPAMYKAERSISDNFYDLSEEKKFEFLVNEYFPKLCSWMNEWIKNINKLGPQFKIVKANPDILNTSETWTNLLDSENIHYNDFEMLDFRKSNHFRSGSTHQFEKYLNDGQIDQLINEQKKHKYLLRYI